MNSEIFGGRQQGFESVRGTESNLLWTEVDGNRVSAVRRWLENESNEPGFIGVKMISKPGWKRTGWMSGYSAGRVKSPAYMKKPTRESRLLCVRSWSCVRTETVDLESASGARSLIGLRESSTAL